MIAPTHLTQHPLSAAFPRLSSEEVDSLLACEGLVSLTEDEAKKVTALEWFKALSVSQRAFFLVVLFDWQAQGSNQHVRKIHTKSPRHLARVARQIIKKSAA